MAMDLDILQRQLQAFAIAHYEESAVVSQVEVMPGHAGLSFGFRVDYQENGQPRDESLVMRLPPKGVRQSGNTDVLRQVPLLQALKRHGVPVATVRWFGGDLRWFEVPYIMVERLPGRTFRSLEPDPSYDLSPQGVSRLYRQVVRALTQIHQLDWQKELAGWETPRALETEIRFWDNILAKAAEPQWVTQGQEVRDLLLQHQPKDPPIGLFHGDFQGSNFLFDGETLVAVLDWEISGIGGQLLDLGWLLVFTDPESWDTPCKPIPSVPPAAELIALYEEGMQRKAQDVTWYRALAGYRFGVISGFNIMLHRRGKRDDPEWENIAPSVPFLFGRAKEMILKSETLTGRRS
ncbi:MAG: phosphotransferase family protein [Deltaproteobacteria bacterium]|nr:phosphotransferase family protein [Deltaproteobacteria bacterium]